MELCDDGNSIPGDGCDASCVPECFQGDENIASGGSCYMLFTTNASHSAADSRCELLGGHLVQISSGSENSLVAGLLVSDAWIGLDDIASEGVFTWDLGANGSAPLGGYHPWASFEPSTSDDCVQLEHGSETWEGRPCTDSRDYVCERPFP
jgi:hypothetical protein